MKIGDPDQVDANKAFEWYQKCVDKGEEQACGSCLFYLAFKYRKSPKMLDLMTRAAKKGLPEAQYKLAVWYDKGNSHLGIVRNLPLAVDYYRQAAANGSAKAKKVWPS